MNREELVKLHKERNVTYDELVEIYKRCKNE